MCQKTSAATHEKKPKTLKYIAESAKSAVKRTSKNHNQLILNTESQKSTEKIF